MNENIYKDRYNVTQHLIENIRIVEIQEFGYDFLDYVVIYHDEFCNAQKLKSLIDDYKNKGTICVIGCCSNQTENLSLTAETKNSFDLYCSHLCTENDLENLVDLLLSVRTGLTHGDPYGIKHFRKDETNNSFSIKYTSYSNKNELTQFFVNLNNEKNFNSFYLSFFCKDEYPIMNNISDIIFQTFKFENNELLSTVVEDNSFDNPKIIVLCS